MIEVHELVCAELGAITPSIQKWSDNTENEKERNKIRERERKRISIFSPTLKNI